MVRKETSKHVLEKPKQGFYSHALTEAEKLLMEEALEVKGLDQEIALLRIKLAELVETNSGRIDLQLSAANAIARLVKTRYQISKEQKNSLKEAVSRVLAEVAAPLGIGVGMGAGMKLTGK
jgi:hypothetical protein